MTNFPKFAATTAILMALATPAFAQYLQAPAGAMVDNSMVAAPHREPADSTPLVDNSVDNSVRTIPPGLKNPDGGVAAANVQAMPENGTVQTAGSVGFISGGISEEGRDGFLAAHQSEGYTAKLLFTGPAGNMLADVDVTILQGSNQILQTSTEGPLLLAALPAGTYTVKASYKGEAQSQRLTVKKSGTSAATFRFKNGE